MKKIAKFCYFCPQNSNGIFERTVLKPKFRNFKGECFIVQVPPLYTLPVHFILGLLLVLLLRKKGLGGVSKNAEFSIGKEENNSTTNLLLRVSSGKSE